MSWQLPIAVICVAWAVFVLARRALRLWTGRGKSAGSCGTGQCAGGACGSGAAPGADARPFVAIESLTADARRSRE